MTRDASTPVAALDCGTNSTRLLVASGEGAALTRLMRITRLGQGVDATGKLAPEAVDRTLAVLGEYRTEMDRLEVGRSRLVATSAVRDAANGGEFLDAAGRMVGVPAELLSGEEEGHLSYVGATADLPPVAGDDVVLDIGGGSTELVVRGVEGVDAVSLDLGCVRLSERFLHHDPPEDHELWSVRETIGVELARAEVAVPQLGPLPQGSRLIGLAGTVSTVAALEQRLDHYERERIHHAVLPRDVVAGWCGRLAALTARQRAALPGMVEGRQDVIVGGVLVLNEVMARFGFLDCLVSESDILDGLVASLLDDWA